MPSHIRKAIHDISLNGSSVTQMSAAKYPAAVGKANRVTIPIGPGSLRAGLILNRSLAYSAAQKTETSTLRWQFQRDRGPATLTVSGLWFLRGTYVGSGMPHSDHAMYLCEFVDARHIAEKFSSTGTAQYNVRAPAAPDTPEGTYLPESLNSSVPWTWDKMIKDLWDKNGVMGTYPSLPYSPHGTPEGMIFTGQNSWKCLNTILHKLGCAVTFDSTLNEFKIIRLGEAQKITIDPLDVVYDAAIIESALTLHPEKINTWHARHHRAYGQEKDTEKDANWLTDFAVEKEEVPPQQAGTGTLNLWDDLTALMDLTNTLENDTELTARAAERADNWTRIAEGGSYLVVMSLLHDLIPGARSKVVTWQNDGMETTTTISNDAGIPWGTNDTGSIVWKSGIEVFAPPDVSRDQLPVYPRLPNIIAPTGPKQTEGAVDYYPGAIHKFRAGAFETSGTCWITSPDQSLEFNTSQYYFGRLSGVVEVGGTQRAVYVCASAGGGGEVFVGKTTAAHAKTATQNVDRWVDGAATGTMDSVVNLFADVESGMFCAYSPSSYVTGETPYIMHAAECDEPPPEGTEPV